MQGKKKFTEKLFTHFQLSDRVPEDNFYRRLKDVLKLQWLYKATQKYYGTEDKESQTVGATRYKAVELHHQWKAKVYKDMPKRKHSKFVSNHTHYSTTDVD